MKNPFMVPQPGGRHVARLAAAGLCLLLAPAGAAIAQAPPAESPARPVKVAVIDVQRILLESKAGQEALASLKALQEQKQTEGAALRDQFTELQSRLNQGRLSLSTERLAALEKEVEDKAISLQRFQSDAERELNKAREEVFAAIEQRVMPIINQLGEEAGYTVIFNKFESGLLFAQEEIDITAIVIQRFNAATQGS